MGPETVKDFVVTVLGAIQVLRNADGGGVIVVCQISRKKALLRCMVQRC